MFNSVCVLILSHFEFPRELPLLWVVEIGQCLFPG